MSVKQQEIKEYINNKVNKLIKLDMIEFFNYIHNNYYNEVDISFMNYFLSLCGKENEFCVEQEKLFEFGVLKSNTESYHTKRTLNEYLSLIENEDYKIIEIEQLRYQKGCTLKKEYWLTPYALKLALIRSKNTKIYARYYILLELVFKFYNDYQSQYQQKLLSMKDDKIDNLTKIVEKQSNDLTIVKNQNDEIKSENKDLKKDLKTVIHIAKEQGVKLGEVHEDLKETKEIVKKLEIKIDELLKLINKFLSGQIDLIYTFNSNIQDTKVLIIYKLQHKNDENKYNLVLRYSGLNQITSSISSFKKKVINKDFNIVSFKIIGTIQQNMISVQQIYKKLDNIDSLNKQTLDNLTNNECDNLIKRVFDIIEENKMKKFSENMESNEILREHADSMKHLMKLDNQFNKEIINIINKYLKDKVFRNKNLLINKLCSELTLLYNRYKS